MSLNPVKTSEEVFERFCGYISTTFRLNNDELNRQIQMALKEPGRFARGPILEVTLPFALGSTLDQLINNQVLSNRFRTVKSSALPLDRPLYIHQEEAIKKITQADRNIVVATGTGSGKTESFMIPILNHLFAQEKQDSLTPGVQALLLYPMNALANDQIKRLRTLLANNSEITFGIYTGETEEKHKDAYEKYLRMYQNAPLSNELISREQMKKTPPHILLTNYAMLEYLMLRPADNVLFQGQYASHWKFIVLDEAHTYTGAKGIEMSMLLARLKHTIGVISGDLRCIMTSATLGRGRDDAELVAKFAADLFREEFTSNDIITASHLNQTEITTSSWGRPNHNFYKEIHDWINKRGADSNKLHSILENNRIPKQHADQFMDTMAADYNKALYELLQGDERIAKAIELLNADSLELKDLASSLFKNCDSAREDTISLIELCNQARLRLDDNPLLPARYHFLVKALEGAFIVLSEKPQVYLERLNYGLVEGAQYRAFELGACTRCHGLYLIGSISETDDGYAYLEPIKSQYNWESNSKLEYFALIDEPNDDTGDDDISNEDDLLEGLGMSIPDFQVYRLCVRCGGIGYDDGQPVCDCDQEQTVRVRKVNRKGEKVHKCGLCGAFNPKGNVVRRFYLSEDAVASVLATALYKKIPKRTILESSETDKDDKLAKYFNQVAAAADEKKSKQLLVFSDSRQNAAYFASYLSSTYSDLLAKSALVTTLMSHRTECLVNQWTLKDFHKRVMRYIQTNRLLYKSVESLSEDVWRWIMREFAVDTGYSSLEQMGLLAFVPDFDKINNCEMLWEIPFLKNKGFEPEEIRIMYNFFLDQFRINRAVEYPEAVNPCDPFFEPQNQQGGFWRCKPDGLRKQPAQYSLKGWKPAGERYSNTRLAYLKRLLAASKVDCNKAEAMNLLNDIFDSILHHQSPLYDYFKSETVNGAGKIYKLDSELYKVVPGRNTQIKYYRCTSCHRVTRYNIRNVCPSFRCDGRLIPVDLDQELRSNHYRNLYLEMKPESLIAQEHTAQLATEYAAEVQTKFIRGDINVLSCSTTFELGVDVGELETVFMKNVPPTPANYAQRAGRAGRRTSSTAYALTYARLASHDFSNFQEPEKMISGVVRPPYFNTDNEKIAKRHLYACAFAMFWRAFQGYFKNLESFFCNDGPTRFCEFLMTKPEALKAMLRTVIPASLHEMVGVNDWKWVEELYAVDGLMTKVTKELDQDLKEIESAIKNAASANHYLKADRLKRIGNTIKSRPLISYLAQKNLLPKYGFPVDVVNLDITSHITEARNIDLSRDMQIAISEYAPDSEVVANGRLWTSRYVKRIPTKELVAYLFVHCSCGYFHKSLETEQNQHMAISCPVCGNKRPRSSTFVVPEFGFMGEAKSRPPGRERPQRTYSSRKFFSGVSTGLETKELWLNGLVRISTHTHGVLTVVNSGKGFGFYLCRTCGYGSVDGNPGEHKNVFGYECKGRFERVSLGYDFETDIVQVDCADALKLNSHPEGYWESLMYSIIEGISYGLDIDRNDIDGTVYVDQHGRRTIILFDTVPGGAGHVKRIMEGDNFRVALESAKLILERCKCGGSKKDTSCYGCLRNYLNQFLHDRLRRDYALEALYQILG